MFYAQFVLSKKGPLAKIWLAAHWEKKLSKAQVFETNVSDAVDEIMKPKVKMALRTTGHLLLGIVRIYSRRAKYLLEDINAAYLKVTMSFNPGKEGKRGAIEDGDGSNLPEIVHDFDSALPDFGELDIPNPPAPINQSRIDDITMREDSSSAGDAGMFGDGLGMDDFGEGGSEFDGNFEDIDPERARRAVSELSNRMLSDNEPLHSDYSKDLNVPRGFDEFSNAEDLDMMLFGDNDVPNGAVNGSMPGDSLQLGALEQESVVNERVNKPRRRKRLIVDEVKNISGEEMKSNMAEYDDIMQPLDLAPPTKKLMILRETGTADKLFSLPGCNAVIDPTLIRIYQSHLVLHAKKADDNAVEDVRRDLEMADNIEEIDNRFTPIDDEFDLGDGGASPMLFDPIDEVDENMQPDVDLPSPTKEVEKRSRKSKQDKDRGDESGEEEGEEDHRCSKRTHAVASAIATKLKSNNSITLNDLLTKSATRKTAAQKFYALLELAKWEAIEVEQASPYGDIIITEGRQMAQVLAS